MERRLLNCEHSKAVTSIRVTFLQSFGGGVGFTLLYLQCCLFEPKWRREQQVHVANGYTNQIRNSVLSHCLSLPIGIFDVLMRDPGMMRRSMPSYTSHFYAVPPRVGSRSEYIQLLSRLLSKQI